MPVLSPWASLGINSADVPSSTNRSLRGPVVVTAKLAQFAKETGALVLRGPLHRPPASRAWWGRAQDPSGFRKPQGSPSTLDSQHI